MGALILNIHSENPELRKIRKVVDELQNGAVILYPTDTGFTLGCQLSNKEAINRIRRIRDISLKKSLTFLCYSLSNIAEFAKVSQKAYETIKRLIPGPYTFILPATKQVPRYAQNPKRKTAGIRVPDSTLSQLLLKELDEPLISISAKINNSEYIHDPEEIFHVYSNKVDVAVSSNEYDFAGESTILDMTSREFSIIREAAGIDDVYDLME